MVKIRDDLLWDNSSNSTTTEYIIIDTVHSGTSIQILITLVCIVGSVYMTMTTVHVVCYKFELIVFTLCCIALSIHFSVITCRRDDYCPNLI